MLKFSACYEFVPGYYLIALDYVCFTYSPPIQAIVTESGAFEGPSTAFAFSHNVSMLMDGRYRILGKLTALSISQDGPGLAALALPVYQF